MAKSFMIIALIAATALFLSVAVTSAKDDVLFVEGNVYCDPCRVEFQTTISTPIDGAGVKLTCRSRENDSITFETSGTTNHDGFYHMQVSGDHEDDICEVRMEHSGNNCNIPFETADRARVLLTKNVGVITPVRTANALGFKTDKVDSRCAQVLEDMGFPPLDAEELLAFSNHN